MARPIIDPQGQAGDEFQSQARRVRGRWTRRHRCPWVKRDGAWRNARRTLVRHGDRAGPRRQRRRHQFSAEAATVRAAETSGIAGDGVQSAKSFSVNQGRTVEVTGPDGVKHPVRIVGPAL